MSFVRLFQKSNSSFNYLRGNVIQSTIEHTRGDMVFIQTGLKSSTVCFQSELSNAFKKTDAKDVQSLDLFRLYNVGIEDIEFFGEPKIVLPKSLQKFCKRKLVWAELTSVWRSSHNRIRGFILNSVNGGYAVAIAGHIAFLPKSLRIGKKIYHSQWRLFSILNMNPKIRNIVVKELASNGGQTKKTRTISSSSKALSARASSSQKEQRKRKAKAHEKKDLARERTGAS